MFMLIKGNGVPVTNSKQYNSSGSCLKLRLCVVLLWTLCKYLGFNMKGCFQMRWTVLHITWLILCKHIHLMTAFITSCVFSHLVIFRLNLVPAFQKHCLYRFMSVEISNETELTLTKALWKSLSRDLNLPFTTLIQQSTYPCKVAAASWYHCTSPNQSCWKKSVSPKEYWQFLT